MNSQQVTINKLIREWGDRPSVMAYIRDGATHLVLTDYSTLQPIGDKFAFRTVEEFERNAEASGVETFYWAGVVI